MCDSAPDSEAILYRFNRLIQELLHGSVKRNCFHRWEIDLLLDIDECNLARARRRETLRRYQRAVQRQLLNGAARPLRLSEYLASRKARRKPDGNRTATGSPSADSSASAVGRLDALSYPESKRPSSPKSIRRS